MGTQQFRVYNKVRETVLNAKVTAVDTTTEHLKRQIEFLATHAGEGLWLKPYRGIPEAPGLPQFDLVYLDENNRVIDEVESFPNPRLGPRRVQAASALALPASSIFASHTQTGDQLMISDLNAAEAGSQAAPAASEAPQAQFTRTEAFAPSMPEERFRQLQSSIQRLNTQQADSRPAKKPSLMMRFLRWLNQDRDPSDRRRDDRHPLPGLVAYHWTGGAPRAYHIGDISESGMYLLTEERPLIGTMILMTLQRIGSDGESPEDSIAMRTKVVRWGPDGVGLAFVFLSSSEFKRSEAQPENGADKKDLEEFLRRLNLPESDEQQKISA